MSAYTDRDARLRKLGFASYAAYLDSELWAGIRRRVHRKHRKCQICLKRRARQVHHRNYELAVLRGDSLDGLLSICGKCHYRAEFNKDGSKRPFDRVEAYIAQRLRSHPKAKPPRKKRPKRDKYASRPWAKFTRAQWNERNKPKPMQGTARPFHKPPGSAQCTQCHCWRITAKRDGICNVCKERGITPDSTTQRMTGNPIGSRA